MIESVHKNRIVLTLAILGIAAAAAAMRVTRWSPVDAFLEPRREQLPQLASTSRTTSGASVVSSTHSSSKPYDPSAVATAPLGGANAKSGGAISSGAGSPAGWSNEATGGATAAGNSSPSVAMGGLWRLMSLARHHQVASTGAVVPHTPRTVTPRAPRPPRPPAPRPPAHGPGAPSMSPPPALVTTAPSVPSSQLIGSNPPPVSGLIGGGTPGGRGGLGGSTPGTVGTGGTGGGSGLSATPEPASLLLIGTGLLGLVSILRRRRS